MSLQFPLLFIYGEQGYHKGLKLVNTPKATTKANKQMSMNMYYSYQIHERVNQYTLLPRGGRLFQQYVVTAYCAIEQDRLDYILQNRSDIRNEYLSGLYDAITRGDRDGSDLGTRLVLTASFTGGPRYMYSHYLDALAIFRVHGNPSFLITFTCNAKWPEIEEYMEAFPELTATDRADIVDRVFEKKVRDYIKFVRNTQTFGDITAVLYTIEFQKRGLPHCHSLLWVTGASKINKDSDVDIYISAELPDPTEDAEGYRVISELMIHGPCGYANTSAPCMKDGTSCDRNFSKPYSDKTSIDKDGYVHYRRRATGIDTERQNVRLDNSSFLEIRTINSVLYPTNKTACEALGLLGGDQEWIEALQEAAISATSSELRKLFIQILMFCVVADPLSLWDMFWKHMSDDIPRRLSKALQLPHIEKSEKKMKASVLLDLEAMLNSNSKSLKDFGLPMPPQDMLKTLQNRLLMEETNYNPELLAKEKETYIQNLNTEQKPIFDEVIAAISENVQKLIFVYGHGGTGKTFLWKAITYALRSDDRIVLVVASSAPMSDRHCFEALDNCLKDILDNPNTLFGGKSIMLGGDFRQTLPVKKKAQNWK
ncbi:DNA helicase [Tanacetum coccineum]